MNAYDGAKYWMAMIIDMFVWLWLVAGADLV